MHEKMFNIINHHGNTNQNHNEISSQTYQNVFYLKTNNKHYIDKRETSCIVLGTVNGCSHNGKRYESESDSCSVVSESLQAHALYSPWNSRGQNTGVGSLSLLQEIFTTQGSNPGLRHCRQILYPLRHKGSGK